MSHLLRSLAPISDDGWDLLDAEAKQQLTTALAARRLVDFGGPHGWKHSATNLGRAQALAPTAVVGLSARSRRVLPLVEVRADFAVTRDELRDNERGALDIDLGELDAAARRIAVAENVAVFQGWESAGIVGIAQASPHEPIGREPAVDAFPRRVAKAVEVLRCAGVDGPYGVALSPEDYTTVVETAEHGGQLLFEHLRAIVGGPIVWAPGVTGAIVLSTRGGDFLFESGQDIAIGYDHHDAADVALYFEESFSFRVATAEAAVVLS